MKWLSLALVLAIGVAGAIWIGRARIARPWSPNVADLPGAAAAAYPDSTEARTAVTSRGTLVASRRTEDGHVNIWETTRDQQRRRQLTLGWDDRLLGIAADGTLAFEHHFESFPVFATDVRTGSRHRITFGEERVAQVIPTPDGRALVLAAWRGFEQLVLHPLDGSPEHILANANGGWFVVGTGFEEGRLYFQRVDPHTRSAEPLQALTAAAVVSPVHDSSIHPLKPEQFFFADAPDRQTRYVVDRVDDVSLRVITNFAERPPLIAGH
jgi:hypothetical protein